MKEKNMLQKMGDAYEAWKEEHPVLDKTIKAGALFILGCIVYSKGKSAGHEVIVYKDNPKDKEDLYVNEVKETIRDNRANIDEDIYCNLAYDIEEAVLSEGLDEACLEEDYDVLFAKHGDYKYGVYETKKHVRVLVTDVTNSENEIEEAMEEVVNE